MSFMQNDIKIYLPEDTGYHETLASLAEELHLTHIRPETYASNRKQGNYFFSTTKYGGIILGVLREDYAFIEACVNPPYDPSNDDTFYITQRNMSAVFSYIQKAGLHEVYIGHEDKKSFLGEIERLSIVAKVEERNNQNSLNVILEK